MLLRKRLAVVVAATLVLALSGGPAAFAANPPGTGQPSQECGGPGATVAPAGFSSGGFANAEEHYAGSDGTPSLAQPTVRTRSRSTTSPATRSRTRAGSDRLNEVVPKESGPPSVVVARGAEPLGAGAALRPGPSSLPLSTGVLRRVVLRSSPNQSARKYVCTICRQSSTPRRRVCSEIWSRLPRRRSTPPRESAPRSRGGYHRLRSNRHPIAVG
jgi:hypothetical protein